MAASNVLKRGERVGDWIIEATLGEGGMGAVYRVHSALTPRLSAALKVLKPTADAEARARFVREAETLSAVRHPAIVHVMGISEDPQRHLLYIVMELATGETLRHRIGRGALTVDEAVPIFTRLASALEHAHAAGVVHRDLKPANIVLCNDGSVRLVDFGIAATQSHEPITEGGHLGTISYVPPEVFRGEKTDPRLADVYSWGLVLHEALTGTRVFPIPAGMTPAAAAAAVGAKKLEQGSFDPGGAVPPRLRELVRGTTQPDPSRRPSMKEVRKTLVSLRERRGQPDMAERTPIPGSVPHPVAVPKVEERTTRVPEPAVQAVNEGSRAERVRRRPAPNRSRLGWAAAAGVLLVGGLAAGVAVIDDNPPRAEVEASDEADPSVTREESGAPSRPPIRLSAPPARVEVPVPTEAMRPPDPGGGTPVSEAEPGPASPPGAVAPSQPATPEPAATVRPSTPEPAAVWITPSSPRPAATPAATPEPEPPEPEPELDPPVPFDGIPERSWVPPPDMASPAPDEPEPSPPSETDPLF